MERILWIVFTLALLGERLHAYLKGRKGEQHLTDAGHIASLKDVNETLATRCTAQKKEIEGLSASYEQAKKELTALALIEIGKLLNFAGMKRDLEDALEENKELRQKLAQSRIEEEVARKSGEYRRGRKE